MSRVTTAQTQLLCFISAEFMETMTGNKVSCCLRRWGNCFLSHPRTSTNKSLTAGKRAAKKASLQRIPSYFIKTLFTLAHLYFPQDVPPCQKASRHHNFASEAANKSGISYQMMTWMHAQLVSAAYSRPLFMTCLFKNYSSRLDSS